MYRHFKFVFNVQFFSALKISINMDLSTNFVSYADIYFSIVSELFKWKGIHELKLKTEE